MTPRPPHPSPLLPARPPHPLHCHLPNTGITEPAPRICTRLPHGLTPRSHRKRNQPKKSKPEDSKSAEEGAAPTAVLEEVGVGLKEAVAPEVEPEEEDEPPVLAQARDPESAEGE